MIILDTNVLSDLRKPKPASRVSEWVAKQPAIELFTTLITEAEIFLAIPREQGAAEWSRPRKEAGIWDLAVGAAVAYPSWL
jgi:predicted nucleic acid-binding protein